MISTELTSFRENLFDQICDFRNDIFSFIFLLFLRNESVSRLCRIEDGQPVSTAMLLMSFVRKAYMAASINWWESGFGIFTFDLPL